MEEKQEEKNIAAVTAEDKKAMMLKRYEKNAGFFFTLAQLMFTAFVIGSLAIFFTNYEFTWGLFGMILVGVAGVAAFYSIGNSFLKLKNKEKIV